MTRFFRAAIVLFLSSYFLTRTHAQADATSTSNFSSSVKAAEYCDFLNREAAEDPYHFFDQAMSCDPYVACIARLGEPGKYFYQVIAGRENFLIRYVSSFNKISYLNWLQERLQATDYRLQENLTADDSLKCNGSDFQVDSSVSNQMLSLATSTAPEKSDSLLSASTLAEICLGVALAMVLKKESDAYRSSGVVAERDPHESDPLLRKNGGAPAPSVPPATAEMLEGYRAPFYQAVVADDFNEGVRLPADQARARAELCMKGFSLNDEVATASPIEVTAVSPTQPGWLKKLKEKAKRFRWYFKHNQEIVAVPVGLDFGDEKGDSFGIPLEVEAVAVAEKEKPGHDIAGKQMTTFRKVKNATRILLMSQDEKKYRDHASAADAKAKKYATEAAKIEKRKFGEGQDMQLVAHYQKAAEAQRRLVRCYSEAAKIEARSKEVDHSSNPWDPMIKAQQLAAEDQENAIREYRSNPHKVARHVMAAEAQQSATLLRHETLSPNTSLNKYLILAAEMQEHLAASSRAMVSAFAHERWDLVYHHWLAEEEKKVARDWSFKALQQAKSLNGTCEAAAYWGDAAKEQAKATVHRSNFFVAADQGDGDASELLKKTAEIQQRLADYRRALAEAFDARDHQAVAFGKQLIKDQKTAVQYSENALEVGRNQKKRSYLTQAAEEQEQAVECSIAAFNLSRRENHDVGVVARWNSAESAFKEASQFSQRVGDGLAEEDPLNWLRRRATLLRNAAQAAQDGDENLANEITAQARNWSEIFEAWQPALKYAAVPALLIAIISEWMAHHGS